MTGPAPALTAIEADQVLAMLTMFWSAPWGSNEPIEPGGPSESELREGVWVEFLRTQVRDLDGAGAALRQLQRTSKWRPTIAEFVTVYEPIARRRADVARQSQVSIPESAGGERETTPEEAAANIARLRDLLRNVASPPT